MAYLHNILHRPSQLGPRSWLFTTYCSRPIRIFFRWPCVGGCGSWCGSAWRAPSPSLRRRILHPRSDCGYLSDPAKPHHCGSLRRQTNPNPMDACPRDWKPASRTSCLWGDEPRKKLALLLDAFARIPDPRARLVVVGHVESLGQSVLRRLANEPRAVHFGRVDEKTLWALYRHAAALVSQASARDSASLSSRHSLQDAGHRLRTQPRCRRLEETSPPTSIRSPRTRRVSWRSAFAKAFLGLLHVDAAAIETHLAQFAWSDAAEALVRIVKIVPKR